VEWRAQKRGRGERGKERKERGGEGSGKLRPLSKILGSAPAIKDCARRFVLLKLTTDRHKASRGLFATAELLVNMAADWQLEFSK